MIHYDDSKTRTKNRKKIVEVAKQLFMEKGISHTTVLDIVKKAKMERKTFYNYFSDKDEIAQYIYYNSMETFYQAGFKEQDYSYCETGYEKIVKYFTTLVEHFVKYNNEMLYVVHLDYYLRQEASQEFVNAIYSKSGMLDPLDFFIEGVKDNSIELNGKQPERVFYVMAQSIGSLASRIIFRGHKNDIHKDDVDYGPLYDLLDVHKNAIRNA